MLIKSLIEFRGNSFDWKCLGFFVETITFNYTLMCNMYRYSQFFTLILYNIESIWIKIKFIIQLHFQIYNKLINYYFNYHIWIMK